MEKNGILRLKENKRLKESKKDFNTIIHILGTNQTLRDNLATNLEYKIIIESLKTYIEEAYKTSLKDIRYKQ